MRPDRHGARNAIRVIRCSGTSITSSTAQGLNHGFGGSKAKEGQGWVARAVVPLVTPP